MPPYEEELSVMEIPGIDVQADGGPHVKNTREIGKIHLSKIETKEKTNEEYILTQKKNLCLES